MQATQRLFIAIELNSEIHSNLNQVITALKGFDQHRINWVKPENIHLTLKFLGETSSQNILQISNALTQAVQEISPFALNVTGTGCFPSPHQPRIFWVGLQAPMQLNDLQKNIEQALLPMKIPVEKRPFSPHLTLARVPEGCPYEIANLIYTRLLQYQKTNFGNLTVEHVTLFQSTLTHEGAIYSRLAAFSLSKTG
jgi:2'-5' RNA ligase